MGIVYNMFGKSGGDDGTLGGLLDGSLTELKIPSGITKIGDYALYHNPITKVTNTSGLTEIGAYAFYSCSALTNISLPNVESLSNNVFNGCSTITTFGFTKSVSFGSGTFTGCVKATDSLVLKTSLLPTSDGFATYGASRNNPSSNPITLDFRESTFRIVNYGLAKGSSSRHTKYINIRFPSTVTSFSGATTVLSYTDYFNLFFLTTTPPTLNSAINTTQNTNLKIFVPYDNVNAYRSATNWATHSSIIYGFTTTPFEVGATLPTTNNEGYPLTWYSDMDMTTSVSAGNGEELYCVVGTTAQS